MVTGLSPRRGFKCTPGRGATNRAWRAETIVTTGLVLQELLQGFTGPRAHRDIVARFAALALVIPDGDDHIGAANLRKRCRRAGVQVGTIDALLAQLCIRHELQLLTNRMTGNSFVLPPQYPGPRWHRV